MSYSYLNFDLDLSPQPPGYLARVLDSPAGHGEHPFTAPDPAGLDDFLKKMGLPRRGKKDDRVTSAKTLGANLYHTVFDGQVLTLWQTSLALAAQQDLGLRLRLRLTRTPGLSDFPWELLYDPDADRFFHLSAHTPLVRYLETPNPPPRLQLSAPLRILVILSLPTDYIPLRVEKEWATLQATLKDLTDRGVIELHLLPAANLPTLRRELRQRDYHILHFAGHGEFDETVGAGALVMVGEAGAGRRITGEVLGANLRDHISTLRLVVLNACDGARADLQDPFSGVAQALIRQDLPSVVAMQFEITDYAAPAFAREFYSALADNLPVDAALGQARLALLDLPTQLEWVTPVLYSRAPDGVIFTVQPPAPSGPAPAPKTSTDQPAPQPASTLVPMPTPASTAGSASPSPSSPAPLDPAMREPAAPASPQPFTGSPFQPLGRWTIQVQDMMGSRLFVEFAPKGIFQMTQEVGMYRVPVNGTWSFNPLYQLLALQGVVNNFQPFSLSLNITGVVENGYTAIGSDGILYILSPT